MQPKQPMQTDGGLAAAADRQGVGRQPDGDQITVPFKPTCSRYRSSVRILEARPMRYFASVLIALSFGCRAPSASEARPPEPSDDPVAAQVAPIAEDERRLIEERGARIASQREQKQVAGEQVVSASLDRELQQLRQRLNGKTAIVVHDEHRGLKSVWSADADRVAIRVALSWTRPLSDSSWTLEHVRHANPHRGHAYLRVVRALKDYTRPGDAVLLEVSTKCPIWLVVEMAEVDAHAHFNVGLLLSTYAGFLESSRYDRFAATVPTLELVALWCNELALDANLSYGEALERLRVTANEARRDPVNQRLTMSESEFTSIGPLDWSRR